MNLFDRDDIENRFGFHKATIEGENATLPKHRDLRIAFMQFAEVLAEALPDGRAKALAFTELEAASMWAHKAIAETAPVVHEKGLMDLSAAARYVYAKRPVRPFTAQEIQTMADQALAREAADDDLCDAINYGDEPAPSRDMSQPCRNNPFRRL